MSVLVYIDQSNEGKLKKAAFEAVCYAAKTAELMGGQEVIAIAIGAADTAELEKLGAYGADKVWKVNNAAFHNFDSGAYAKIVSEAAEASGAETVVISYNSTGKALAPRVAVRLKAGFVAGAIDVPSINGDFTVRKSVFSGKAFAEYSLHSSKKVIAVNPNAYTVTKGEGTAPVEDFATSVGADAVKVKVLEVSKASDTIPLPEADLVVSAGRGLKGPENWGMIEELAQLLGAATACSRPVADVDWRPHHEHVGQTGLTIRPTLYIAVGISGAIQHLAGVNNSKVIVVINTDPEAPFFKAADYGIVGDAFEVVPKIIEAVKELKSK
ncbi:MAG: electron transfer flavoprotein subunit alpha/FixB family protein [Chitinophagales bacterium]